MANKYAGIGAALKHGDGGGPEVFTTVPSCKVLNGPKLDSTMIDTTTLDVTGGYETFVMGLKKPGTVAFDIMWDPQDATHRAIFADYDSKTLRNWQIVWPDMGSETFSFAAYVKMPGDPKAEPNTALVASVELQISGPVTRS
jgi:predicted secreted protein